MESATLFPHQEDFVSSVGSLRTPVRACLYFRTGAGKSLTAMLGMMQLGYSEVLVIAPPATHAQWAELADDLGMSVTTMSHALFRMVKTKIKRTIPIIADEFHLFGGQQGQGWKKLDKIAQHLQVPIFLLSATPQYNDAERVYCVQHILDPASCRGGFLQFLYQNCITEQNPFAQTPNVLGFQKFASAEEYLAAMKNVFYLKDELVYSIQNVPFPSMLPYALTEYGYDEVEHRIMASSIEEMHTKVVRSMVDTGLLKPAVYELLKPLILGPEPVLVFSVHVEIVMALSRQLVQEGVEHLVLTGKTPNKAEVIGDFLDGRSKILIGTATLATGTDGLDKVCNRLVILDDTQDNALRRQLIGRIMPRGSSQNLSDKEVYRFTPS